MFFVSLLLVSITAVVGAWASAAAPAFYDSLVRPAWAPPAWLFGPVWTLLYILMALAAWWLWRCQGWSRARTPLLLYLMHLPLNAAWSWVFFVGQNGAWASLHILVLLAMIVALVLLSWGRAHLSALLLLPYLGWVGFASLLCLVLWRLNPELL